MITSFLKPTISLTLILLSVTASAFDGAKIQNSVVTAIRLRQKLTSLQGLQVRHVNKIVTAEGSSQQSSISGSGYIGIGIGGSKSISSGNSKFVAFEKSPYFSEMTFNVNFEASWADADNYCASVQLYQNFTIGRKKMNSEQDLQVLFQTLSALTIALQDLEIAGSTLPASDLTVLPKINDLLTWARSSTLRINKYYPLIDKNIFKENEYSAHCAFGVRDYRKLTQPDPAETSVIPLLK